MKHIDKLYVLFIGAAVAWITVSCVKQKEPEATIRVLPPELLELDDEELEDLPEDSGEEL